MEKREEILMRLKLLLKATDAGRNIDNLVLDPEQEVVTLSFIKGGVKNINIAGDSGIMMIKDIVEKI